MMHIMKGCLNIEPYAQVQLVLPCPICHRSKHCLHSSLLVGKMTRIKCFRVLTGWLVGSQVFEMDAFDDLHRQTSCGGVVHQADKDLWCGCLTDWLEWWGAFTACHIWEADLGFTALKMFHTKLFTGICCCTMDAWLQTDVDKASHFQQATMNFYIWKISLAIVS